MTLLLLSFLTSFLINFWVVRYGHLHTHITADNSLSGVQIFHSMIVPRVGGVGIFLATLLALTATFFYDLQSGALGLWLIFASLPIFLAGLAEDTIKKTGVYIRFLAAMASAGLASYILNTWLLGVQVPGVDALMLTYPILSIAFTCFAVTGVINAFNIIDGYNGLAAMVAAIILACIAYVGFLVRDYTVIVLALAIVGPILGFLVWNYPRGLIFLGDCGAYFLGFWVAELSLLLVSRHSQVSKWFPLLLCFYPIFETLFTIYRRLIMRRINPGLPDALHLHQMIHRRVVARPLESINVDVKNKQNSLTSPYLWALCLIAAIPAVLFWQNHLLLKLFTLLFIFMYIWLYWSIVHFKVPKYLLDSIRVKCR